MLIKVWLVQQVKNDRLKFLRQVNFGWKSNSTSTLQFNFSHWYILSISIERILKQHIYLWFWWVLIQVKEWNWKGWNHRHHSLMYTWDTIINTIYSLVLIWVPNYICKLMLLSKCCGLVPQIRIVFCQIGNGSLEKRFQFQSNMLKCKDFLM